MTRFIVGLFLAAALLAGCAGDMGYVGKVYPGGIAYEDQVGIVRSDSACDELGRRAQTDTASPCFVSRRNANM
jgi:hypothetical protein